MLSPERTLDGVQVLVVDDSPDITSLLSEVLIDEGASVVPANSGTAAIVLITLIRFDLLILDLTMPQPDGFSVVEFVRATQPALLQRTIIMTGHTFNKETMAMVKKLDMPCLTKPFQLKDLVNSASRMSLPRWMPSPAA